MIRVLQTRKFVLISLQNVWATTATTTAKTTMFSTKIGWGFVIAIIVIMMMWMWNMEFNAHDHFRDDKYAQTIKVIELITHIWFGCAVFVLFCRFVSDDVWFIYLFENGITNLDWSRNQDKENEMHIPVYLECHIRRSKINSMG